MPRNSSGVYTLPVAAFTAGTVIKSTDMNTDLSDIAAALTGSVATNGVSSMTGVFKLFGGTVDAPGLTLASDTTTGWYSSDDGEWTFVSQGTPALTVSASVFEVLGDTTFLGDVTFSGDVTYSGDLTVDNVISGTVTVAEQASIPVSPGLSEFKLFYRNSGGASGDKLYGVDGAGDVSTLMFAGGQCRLTLDTSGLYANKLVLRPYMGNLLTINRRPCEVADDRVTGTYPSLSASNTANTFVYIYAYMNTQNSMKLEMSTTAPVDTTPNGIRYKTGDESRTLVGAAYTDTGGAWADTNGKLWVISYFNRKPKRSRYFPATSLGTYIAATVTVSQEVTASFRNQFITWDDEIVRSEISMTWNTGVVGGTSFLYPRYDNGADANTLAQTGPIAFTLPTTFNGANFIAVASGLSAGAVHFFSPTYISSANNIQFITTQTVSATSTSTFYTIVEIMG